MTKQENYAILNAEANTYAQSPTAAKTVLSSDSRKDARRPFEIAKSIALSHKKSGLSGLFMRFLLLNRKHDEGGAQDEKIKYYETAAGL